MRVVLIWASNNPEKFWNKILKNLVSKWHMIFPVNPKEEKIENLKAYKKISDINDNYEIINFVIRPELTLSILQENLEILKNKTIWCQAWASNDEIKEFLERNWFRNYITDSCIMLQDINKKIK